MRRFFEQYKGLKREMYILFYGRIVTSMGSLIWPLVTLILKNKMGLGAGTIASLVLVMSIIQLPLNLLGGKMADKLNKKKIIICCDLVTVVCYLICGFIPLSYVSIALFYTASAFAAMEAPAYDTLVADLTSGEEREKAYSLSYLGTNLGLVLAPTIGGLLFASHLNLAFIINSVCTFSSTILIAIFVKDLKRETDEKEKVNVYEKSGGSKSVLSIIFSKKTLILYILAGGVGRLVYSQFNFMIPLNLEMLYGAKGATLFGMMTSTNAAVVILGTPILTKLLEGLRDIQKMILGQICVVVALGMYIFVQGMIPMYFISMILLTIGEILDVLANMPFLTRRVPSTHRGRIFSINIIFCTIFYSLGNKGLGQLVDRMAIVSVWKIVVAVGVLAILLRIILAFVDKKEYSLLYNERDKNCEKNDMR